MQAVARAAQTEYKRGMPSAPLLHRALPGALALAVHVGLAALVWRVKSEPPPAEAPQDVEVELAIESAAAPADVAREEEEDVTRAAARGEGVRSVQDARASSARAALTGSVQSAPNPASASEAGEPAAIGRAAEGWSLSLLQGNAAADPLQGLRPSAAAIASMLPESPSKPRVDDPAQRGLRRIDDVAGMKSALREADVRHGLGHAGVVLSAAKNVVSGEYALVEGRATYEAHIDAQGVLRVSLLDASQERSAWAHLADAIAKRIDRKRMRLADGVAWRGVVEVEVRQQYPNGAQPKELGTKLTASAGRMRPNPTVEDLPGVALVHRGKVCSGGLYAGAAGVGLMGGCDLSNLGANVRRVVQGRVLEEQTL